MTIKQYARNIQQPRGGYLPARDFKQIRCGTDPLPYKDENIRPWKIEKTVINLTRAHFIGPWKTFERAMIGSETVGRRKDAEWLLSRINGLDDRSICDAIQLSGFDVYSGLLDDRPEDWGKPDKTTIEHIRAMAARTVAFICETGPVDTAMPSFPGAYTPVISDGMLDIMSGGTLWRITVTSKPRLDKRNTMELWLGKFLSQYTKGPMRDKYDKMTALGIYNPRLDAAWKAELDSIPNTWDPIAGLDVMFGEASTELETIRILCDMQQLEPEDLYAIQQTIEYVHSFTQPYAYDQYGNVICCSPPPDPIDVTMDEPYTDIQEEPWA